MNEGLLPPTSLQSRGKQCALESNMLSAESCLQWHKNKEGHFQLVYEHRSGEERQARLAQVTAHRVGTSKLPAMES